MQIKVLTVAQLFSIMLNDVLKQHLINGGKGYYLRSDEDKNKLIDEVLKRAFSEFKIGHAVDTSLPLADLMFHEFSKLQWSGMSLQQKFEIVANAIRIKA